MYLVRVGRNKISKFYAFACKDEIETISSNCGIILFCIERLDTRLSMNRRKMNIH